MDFRFDEESHTYYLNNQVIPGLTSILEAEGFIDKTWFTEWGRERGRIVHKATHLSDKGTLDWGSIDPRIEGYLRAYEDFKEQTGFEVLISEEPMCSYLYRFGTTPDRLGMLNGDFAMVDFKTGPVSPWVALQTAAQVIALREFHPEYKDAKIKRFGLELRGKGNYRLHEFSDKYDGNIFLSALAIHNWKKNNRR